MPLKRVLIYSAILSVSVIFISIGVVLSKDVKSPIVKWTPEKVELAVFRGTSKIQNVSFSSSQDIENIKLELVPGLAKFISVQPENMAKVTAGQNNSVGLFFAVPQETATGTYDGTLHLKLDKRTIPQTLKVILNVKEPTAEEIPEDISLPTADRIKEDAIIGQNYVKDEIIVKFKDGTSGEIIKQVVGDIGGVFIGFLKDLEIYQVQVDVIGFSELDQKISQVEQNQNVEFAGRQITIIPDFSK